MARRTGTGQDVRGAGGGTERRNDRFLAAYSGLLANRNDWPFFVPPVFDLQKHDEYFQQEDAIISRMPDGEEKSNRSRALQMWLFRQFTAPWL